MVDTDTDTKEEERTLLLGFAAGCLFSSWAVRQDKEVLLRDLYRSAGYDTDSLSLGVLLFKAQALAQSMQAAFARAPGAPHSLRPAKAPGNTPKEEVGMDAISEQRSCVRCRQPLPASAGMDICVPCVPKAGLETLRCTSPQWAGVAVGAYERIVRLEAEVAALKAELEEEIGVLRATLGRADAEIGTLKELLTEVEARERRWKDLLAEAGTRERKLKDLLAAGKDGAAPGDSGGVITIQPVPDGGRTLISGSTPEFGGYDYTATHTVAAPPPETRSGNGEKDEHVRPPAEKGCDLADSPDTRLSDPVVRGGWDGNIGRGGGGMDMG